MLHRLLCALPLLVLVACGGSEAGEQPAPLPVEVARVGAPSAAARITATGALGREREMVLSFRIPGLIRSLSVDNGDQVTTGAVIATLDATQVAAGAQRAAAELERARRNLSRDRTLAERGYVSAQRLADRRTAVEAAQASYDGAAFERRGATLASPVSGVVLLRRAQAGEVVQPGQPVVVVADASSPMVLRVTVPDSQASRLRIGAGAMVRLGVADIGGQVSRIGERVEQGTGMVIVEIRIAAHPDLRSGQIGTAEIDADPPAHASGFTRIPAEAILEAGGGRAFVFRLDEEANVARRTQVAFGGFDGDDALVRGLTPGAAVVTAGAGYLSDGQAAAVAAPLAGAGR